jgi:hypothetical protein
MRYVVRDASGALVAIHCRQDGPDGKRMWWEQPDGTLGLGGLSTTDLPLFRIDQLSSSATVVLVEGEKAAEALLAIGVEAVGTVTGASGTPGATPLAELTGRRVYLWPDNDNVGQKDMQRIGSALVGIAAAVSIIAWSDAAEHGDAADFLTAGGTREDVELLVAAALPLTVGGTSGSAHVGSEPWEPPVSLDRWADLPAFPVDALPVWLAAYVEAEAVATQTPPDMAAMFGLTALATVAGGRVVVQPRPGWLEGVNLFGVVAMEPGSRKSAVHRDMTAPLIAHERDLAAAARPELANAASRRRVAEATLARLEKAVGSAKPEDRDAAERERFTAAVALDLLAVPTEPRLFTSDATPEALASLLFAQGGRMSVLSPEGGIFELMAGRYSNSIPNLDVFLSGHAGDLLRVDRKGRPTEYVERPALTIGVAAQPAVLRRAARIPEMPGRGLLDRFLYALPTPNVGFRDTDPPPVPDLIRERYATTVRTLASSLEACDGPITLRFTAEAIAILLAWSAELEPRRRPDAELGHIQGWAAKLDGATVRIAGLLHLADHVGDGWERPIEADTMRAAVKIGRYLVAHALAVFDYMGADPRLEAARRIGQWIVAGRHAVFTKRQAFRDLRGQAIFPTIDGLAAGLAALDEHGWVRLLEPPRRPGRPSSRYETNPAMFLEAWTKWPEPPTSPDPDSVLSILSIDSRGSATDALEREGAPREPDLSARGLAAPLEPAELGDWFAAPTRETNLGAPDEWGTLG